MNYELKLDRCLNNETLLLKIYFAFVVFAVTAVPNGLQAWKVLEDPGNHIDLILTEVAMPILSGIGLLGKIMSHKTLKNIPVISKWCSKLCVKCLFIFQ